MEITSLSSSFHNPDLCCLRGSQILRSIRREALKSSELKDSSACNSRSQLLLPVKVKRQTSCKLTPNLLPECMLV